MAVILMACSVYGHIYSFNSGCRKTGSSICNGELTKGEWHQDLFLSLQVIFSQITVELVCAYNGNDIELFKNNPISS